MSGAAALISNQKALTCLTSFYAKHDPYSFLKVCEAIKMNVQEAINFRLKKLGFEEIRVNQCGVVERNIGRDVLMISPTASGKSSTFHIAPFVLDFFDMVKEKLSRQLVLLFFL